ncbi:uncharacterized protein LOC144667239 [Oculina patagonica]
MISSKWLCGPEFLSREEDLWPRDPSHQLKELSADDPELKRDVQTFSQAVLNQPAEDFLSRIFHQYSSWDKLRKAFAWLLRFKNWSVQRPRGLSVNSSSSVSQSPRGELSVDEVRVAEREIIRHLQKLSFPKVFEALRRISRNQVSARQVKPHLRKLKSALPLRKLCPVLDGDGILRIGGKLENVGINFDAKHQIVLPYRHHVTDLIIQKCHQDAGHPGQEYVLSNLRQLYWIVKGRSAVRRVLSECFLCRKLGAARGEQLMANLPKERLSPGDPPFTSVGLDYFGPLYVKQGRSNVKR